MARKQPTPLPRTSARNYIDMSTPCESVISNMRQFSSCPEVPIAKSQANAVNTHSRPEVALRAPHCYVNVGKTHSRAVIPSYKPAESAMQEKFSVLSQQSAIQNQQIVDLTKKLAIITQQNAEQALHIADLTNQRDNALNIINDMFQHKDDADTIHVSASPNVAQVSSTVSLQARGFLARVGGLLRFGRNTASVSISIPESSQVPAFVKRRTSKMQQNQAETREEFELDEFQPTDTSARRANLRSATDRLDVTSSQPIYARLNPRPNRSASLSQQKIAMTVNNVSQLFDSEDDYEIMA